MRDDRERLLDILESIRRIERVAARGREYFYNNEMAQVWIIYHLQIIGEAVRGVSSEFRAKNPGIPWSEIIGMRNILIHHYFGIDRDAVWSVVEHDLPNLKNQILSKIQGE
ncbi:DUF86 domain-containing protein [Methanoculleus sp.]|uniref:HepT-like ribonuclease domain-containing protein n=1 Tax=Methanoculleus sp. TaxID=90427 RepID=UPI0025F6914E|nr:DUF86 domain-containing protein [Methanoculleus sp.]